MTDPIAKTMQLLTTTANSHAVEVLILALDITNEHVQKLAAVALLKRDSTRGQVEVIRRLQTLCPETRSSIESEVSRLSNALRQSLIHGDTELRRNSLELIQTTENYGQISTLLEMLKNDRSELNQLAVEALRELVNRLYEQSHSDKKSAGLGKFLRNAAKIRHTVLTSFDSACSSLDKLAHAEDVIEGVLILGDVQNFAVKKVLWQGDEKHREIAGQLLLHSKHPGVMQLVLDFLSMNYPHPRAFEAISTRQDPEFIAHLLRWFPKRPSQMQQKNFRQIESIAWIDPYKISLEVVPPSLQPSLVAFIATTGLPSEQKFGVEEWLIRHGTQEGRLAAAGVLGSLDSGTVQNIVTSSLDSDDEEIQAWATGQLRSQGITEALSLLVDRLDSPLEAVREAAREELKSFDVLKMIQMFEDIDPAVCRRAGQLIEKIDPDCHQKLREELASPIQRRRIRAARAAQIMGMHLKVVPALIEMLEDDDAMVRRTAVEVLGSIRSADSMGAIQGMLDDESLRVREIAAKILEQAKTLPVGLNAEHV